VQAFYLSFILEIVTFLRDLNCIEREDMSSKKKEYVVKGEVSIFVPYISFQDYSYLR
jgi:hypothetical protein